jgi:aminoglycoside 6'-N-acetyltransferase I
MENYTICDINESAETMEKAAKILLETMPEANMWPDLNEEMAFETVEECIAENNICIGIKVNDQLIGWVGLIPMYKNTWELHPMAILPLFQGKGYGKILLNELENIAQEKGIIGIFAGSDDEANKTSLSETDLTKDNIFEEINNIKNYKNHPYEFYLRCGYSIIGIIPNANGLNKPDILLWKDIRKN